MISPETLAAAQSVTRHGARKAMLAARLAHTAATATVADAWPDRDDLGPAAVQTPLHHTAHHTAHHPVHHPVHHPGPLPGQTPSPQP